MILMTNRKNRTKSNYSGVSAASSRPARIHCSFFGGRQEKRTACYHIVIMSADRGELDFYSARVFIPQGLLDTACKSLAAANLHPITRDRLAILRLSGQEAPIAGRFVEIAGTCADANGLPEILAGLGLPPEFFDPVAWGTFDLISHPAKPVDTPWNLDI